MNKQILLTTFCLLFTTFCQAQQYKWVKGGGGTRVPQTNYGSETVTHIITDDNRNIYALAVMTDRNIVADTFNKANAYNTYSGFPLRHIFFFSYDCNGNMRFAKLIEADNYSFGFGLRYFAGKVYLAISNYIGHKHIGDDYAPTSVNQACGLIKYDTSGQFDWVQYAGPDIVSTYQNTQAFGAISIDGQGNIHRYNYFYSGVQLTSTVTTTTGNYDLKYDISGNLLSATKMQIADTNYSVKQVEFDKQTGKSYVLFAQISPLTNFTQSYLIAYDNSGNTIWSDSVSLRCVIPDFVYQPGDGIYISGQGTINYTFTVGGLSTTNTTYPNRPYSLIMRLDTNGIGKRVYRIDCGPTGSVLGLFSLNILPNYNLALCGEVGGKAKYGNDSIVTAGSGYNPMLFIIDTAGKLIKMDQMASSGFYDGAEALGHDKVGNIYIGGQIETNIIPTGLSGYTSHGGNTDYFLVKYGYDCSCLAPPTSNFTYTNSTGSHAAQFTFTGTTPVDSVFWDWGDGNTTTQKTQTAPSHTYAVFGTYNVCATVYTPCGSSKQCKTVQVTVSVNALWGEELKIYPNPVSNELVIEGIDKNFKIEVADITGKNLLEQISTDKKETINTGKLWVGTYLLIISDEKGQRVVRTIVKE